MPALLSHHGPLMLLSLLSGSAHAATCASGGTSRASTCTIPTPTASQSEVGYTAGCRHSIPAAPITGPYGFNMQMTVGARLVIEQCRTPASARFILDVSFPGTPGRTLDALIAEAVGRLGSSADFDSATNTFTLEYSTTSTRTWEFQVPVLALDIPGFGHADVFAKPSLTVNLGAAQLATTLDVDLCVGIEMSRVLMRVMPRSLRGVEMCGDSLPQCLNPVATYNHAMYTGGRDTPDCDGAAGNNGWQTCTAEKLWCWMTQDSDNGVTRGINMYALAGSPPVTFLSSTLSLPTASSCSTTSSSSCELAAPGAVATVPTSTASSATTAISSPPSAATTATSSPPSATGSQASQTLVSTSFTLAASPASFDQSTFVRLLQTQFPSVNDIRATVVNGAASTGSCTNTCTYASDDECDDGGPGAEYAECSLGTDCVDCGGDRSGGTAPAGGYSPPPPPFPSPPPPTPSPPPAPSGGCTNACLYASDGDCDDGGPGSEYEVCIIGTDCADCSNRPVTTGTVCLDDCGFYSSDGDCDDGGPGSEYSSCALGHDCTDCSPTGVSSSGAGGNSCTDNCLYATDGYCDDGGPGSQYSACTTGTDCTDCTASQGRRLQSASNTIVEVTFIASSPSNAQVISSALTSTTPAEMSSTWFGGSYVVTAVSTPTTTTGTTTAVCTNICGSANDGDCDDGGPGAEFSICALGADCTDCGPRSSGSGSTPGGGSTPPPPDDGSSMIMIIGIAAGAAVVLIIIVVCCCMMQATPSAVDEPKPRSAETSSTVELSSVTVAAVDTAVAPTAVPQVAPVVQPLIMQESTMIITLHKPTADTKVGVVFSSLHGATTVSSVVEGSLSATAGLKQGQKVVSINGTVVTGSIQCTDLIKAAGGAIQIIVLQSVPVAPTVPTAVAIAVVTNPPNSAPSGDDVSA